MPDVHTYPNLAALRALTRGAASVRVAVIDGPVDMTHPCFAGASLVSTPATWTSVDRNDDGFLTHGTGVASMLFGQKDTDVEGVAPGVTGILIPAARQEDDITELSLLRALDAALDANADIIHCAFCLRRGTPKATVSAHLARLLDQIRERGVLLIAPSGNDGGQASCAPADQDGVLAVGALNNDGTVRDTSNHGVAFNGHGVMAIGEDVHVADTGHGVATHSGTSVAAPWVTGVAALLLSAAREQGLHLTAREAGQLIVDTAEPLTDNRAIGGVMRPDLAAAALTTRTQHAAQLSYATPQGATAASPTRSAVRALSRYVYVLGQLACEPVDDAAYDRLRVLMRDAQVSGTPDSSFSLLTYLRSAPHDADLTHFVLQIGTKPRYVLTPAGPHAHQVNDRLIALASASIGIDAIPALIERVAVPGFVSHDTTTTRDGTVLPVITVTIPDALTGWRTKDVCDAALAGFGDVTDDSRQLLNVLLDRVCEQQFNDGVAAADRAFNYTAANATQLAHIAIEMSAVGAALVSLTVQPSRYDRPRSDCWDVLATFADPHEPSRSWWQWVWTVDVGDLRPVTINWPRAWRIEPRGVALEINV